MMKQTGDPNISYLFVCNKGDDVFHPTNNLISGWSETRIHSLSDLLLLLEQEKLHFDIVIVDLTLQDHKYNPTIDQTFRFVQNLIGGETAYMVITSEPHLSIYDLIKYGVVGFLDKGAYDHEKWQLEIKKNYIKFINREIYTEKIFTKVEALNRFLFDLELILKESHLPLFIWGERGSGKSFICRKLIGENIQIDIYKKEEISHSNNSWKLELDNKVFEKNKIILIEYIDNNNDGDLSSAQQEQILSLIKRGRKIIVTSQISLEELKGKIALSPELVHFLGNYPIYIWPLRERKIDIEDFIDDFLKDMKTCLLQSNFFGRKVEEVFTVEAITKLKEHSWPRNLSELKNTIHSAIAKAFKNKLNHRIGVDNLPNKFLTIYSEKDLKSIMIKSEIYQYLEDVESRLSKSKDDIAYVAGSLGFSDEYELKKKIYGLYMDFPEFITSSNFETTVRSFEIQHEFDGKLDLFIWYHENSIEYAQGLKLSIKNGIKHLPVNIIDKLDEQENDAHFNFAEWLETVQILLFFLCPDSIDHEEIDLIYKRIRSEKKEYLDIPILARKIDLEVVEKNINKNQMLPRNERTLSSIKRSGELEDEYIEIAKQIRVSILAKYAKNPLT